MNTLTLAWLCACAASAAVAQQAIERHIPPPVQGESSDVNVPEQPQDSSDTTSFGVNLSGINLLSATEEVSERPAKGISASSLEVLDKTEVDVLLRPFLGRPLSPALISEVQSTLVRLFRKTDYPFVSVIVPPQEITGGILQLRVTEFRLSDVSVPSDDTGRSAGLRNRIRLRKDGRISARQLSEDIEWLNRTPYRSVQSEFSPGDEQATTRLDLKVTRQKPWSVTSGWSNSGSPISGRDRVFIGGGIWLEGLKGTTLTYQLTSNEDVVRNPARISLPANDMPRYVSHAGRITIPTLPRQELEIVPSYVSTFQKADRFISFENRVVEIPVIYRSALSNLIPDVYFGDIYAGAEFKFMSRTTFFDGASVAQGNAELFNVLLGWSHKDTDRFGRTSVDVKIKGNPGGVLAENTDKVWNLFSGGRVDDVNYLIGGIDVTRITVFPRSFSWVSQLSAVAAWQPLPDVERMALGGFHAVRGYGMDDVSVDTGLIWRNELRLPPINLLSRFSRTLQDGLLPFLFADIGYGRDLAQANSRTVASVGVGLDYGVTEHFTMGMALGYALRDADRTRAGDWNLQARIGIAF